MTHLRSLHGFYPQKWVQVSVLTGLCVLLFFVNLGQWDLWNPDEPRYAEVSREMVEGGDWILMHFNGEVYPDKPPLFFWAISLSSFLWGGFDSFSTRFPSAFFATLTVLLTFLIGTRLFCHRTGFLSGLVLATNVEFAYLATRANIDATLTFFTTVSIFCFLHWYERREGNARNFFDRFSIYGFYVTMALGTLTKGPVGMILPLLVAFLYLLARRDWKALRGMKLLYGISLFAFLTLLWYVPAVAKGGEGYLRETLLRHTIERYASGWSHVKPVYYYLYKFPVDLLPWSFFFPAAIIYGYLKMRQEAKEEFTFLVVWFLSIFIFFSFSKGKRELYLLPLYPAASIMVGKVWNDFITGSMKGLKQQWIVFAIYLVSIFAAVSGVAIPVVLRFKFPAYFHYVGYSLPVSFLLVGGGAIMFLLGKAKKYGAVFFLIVFVFSTGFFYTLRFVFPVINEYKSGRYIAEQVKSRIKPGDRLVVYGGFKTGPYNFYTGIVPIPVIENREELSKILRSFEKVFCIMKLRDFEPFMAAKDKPDVELITQRQVGDDVFVLFTNRPGAKQ